MNKLKIVLTVAALVVAGAASAQDLNAKYAQAVEAFNAKNYAAAVPLFEQVIAEGVDVEGAEASVNGAKQNLPGAVFQLGGIAFQGGKLDDALAAFTKSAKLAEDYENVQILTRARTWISNTVSKQAEVAYNAKDYATAAAIFQKGYDANPNDTKLGLNLADSYSRIKAFDKSAPIYKNIIALGAKDSRFEADAAEAQKNYSLDVLEQATESAKAGNYEAAIAVTDSLLAVIPVDPAANLTRLQAYNSMKNYAKVVELGEAAAAAQVTDETRSDVYYLVGAAYQNMQNLPKAIETYRKVTAGDYVAGAKTQITELQKVAQ